MDKSILFFCTMVLGCAAWGFLNELTSSRRYELEGRFFYSIWFYFKLYAKNLTLATLFVSFNILIGQGLYKLLDLLMIS